jgi:hypothetical protein
MIEIKINSYQEVININGILALYHTATIFVPNSVM